jgi:hypothetical protein
MRKLITTGLLLGLLSLTALAADVTGKWTAQMPRGGGQGRGGQGGGQGGGGGQGRGGPARETVFNFKVDGGTLTGTIGGFRGETPISEGKIDGDTISFAQTMEFNGNSVKLLYKGTVSGDSIAFTRTRDGGDQPPQEFTAKRAQ